MEVEQDHMVMSRGMEDRKGMAVMAAWWCYRGETITNSHLLFVMGALIL